LDLARWLVARDNPLTARVFVNRLWRLFYGAGLARSLDDAGTRGPWPSHPELLDWLAVEFMDSGWDVKHIVRLMVTSSTYRQSSQADEATQQRDPANRLLARQARFRLEAEMVRDHVLAVSGLLEGSVGGPSVKPYQPAGYWDQLNFPKRTWEHDHRTALYRRGLYTFWCRTFLHPSLAAFDACPREEASVERAPSNTPLQALALLNDPSYVEAARVFAERILQRGGRRFDRRLRFAFDQALARKPDPREVAVLGDLFRKQLDLHQREPDNARHLVKVGERPMATGLDPVELAAWTEIARTLLNLHESITRP
jgi:hypothetical protein